MSYPDFAFYHTTKLILFLINCLTTTCNYYFGAKLVLKIYQKNCSTKRKLFFSFIAAILLNVLIIYTVSYLNGFINNLSTPYFGGSSRAVIGQFFNFFVIINPFAYIVLYFLGVRILNLSKYESISIMRLSYIYFICCTLFYKIGSLSLFPVQADGRGWNFLRDIFVLLFGVCGIYLLYRIACLFINKSKIYIDYPYHMVFKSLRREFIINFFICTLIYAITVTLLFYSNLDIIHVILLFLLLFVSIFSKIHQDYSKIYHTKLDNKDEHILSLNKAINEFNGIRHDFNNILQTYSGYLMVKDYQKLQAYHQKTTSMTISAQSSLDIASRIAENPSFFALLANKLEKAKQHSVSLQVSILCDMKSNYIDELDFNRIMAILLDNAIEAAELTPRKRTNLTCQLKTDKSKLIILSNDIACHLNMDKIFTPGFTTKPGHIGQGLTQVRHILEKYGSTTFNITHFRGSFTIYFELKPLF